MTGAFFMGQASGDPWASLDGRLNAPVGTPPYPSLLSGYPTASAPNARMRWPSSGAQPPWMVAGVDYSVGIDRSLYPTNASLKDPSSATLPSGVTRDATNQSLIVSGSNVTLDGFDMSLHGGWKIVYTDGISNLAITNCNWKLGTFQASDMDGSQYNVFVVGNGSGNDQVTNFTMKNCEVDGDGSITNYTTNGTTASGGTVLNFASTAGIVLGMLVGSFTNLPIVNGTVNPNRTLPNPEVGDANWPYVTAVTSTQVTISQPTRQAVPVGEVFSFAPVTGQGGTPAISVNDPGNTTLAYNYIRNLDEAYQGTPGTGTTGSFTGNFNLIDNIGVHAKIFAVHGDFFQLYGTAAGSNWDAIECNFNTVTIPAGGGGGQGFAILAASPNVTTVQNATLNNNTIANIAPASVNYGLSAVSISWCNSITQNDNYIDPTGDAYPTTSDPTGWSSIGVYTITAGSYTCSETSSGNINMLDGSSLGAPL